MNPDEWVCTEYHDAFGKQRIVPAETRATFVAALEASALDGIAPPTLVIREGEPLAIDVTVPRESEDARALWTARDDRGFVGAGTLPMALAPLQRSSQREGAAFDTRRLTLPFTPTVGRYRVTVDVATFGHAGIDVLVTPQRAFLPSGEPRIWGIAVQLYALRSQRNWGIGDFGDLSAVCAIAADAGASLVGINPLHASHRADPEAASPYAPASRRFLNWLAVDVEGVPESQHADVQVVVASLSAELAELRSLPFIDYTRVAQAKDRALRTCFRVLAGTRRDAFNAYVRAAGAPLRRFAIYEALVAHYGRDADLWPASMLNPDHPDVAVFARGAHDEVEYGMYLQWCATEQFEAVAQSAHRHGVAIYRDLAVGVERNSADVWGVTEYVTVATVGAPPDPLNHLGQDWGLPPLSPTALPRDAYAGFAGLLADNMKYAGALRIDHAMSLARLFWIPRGAPAEAGAYVVYPLADLLGVLARESVRSRCMVIGEDLGTVPEGFRERMAENNVLAYRILMFERRPDGTFTPPGDYPALALAATGTHDLPPLAGWLLGADIDIRERIGMIDARLATAERAARGLDIAHLTAALAQSGALGEERDAEAIVLAAHRYLAASPARILMVQLEDIVGETTPVNVPGTNDEYANWRRKVREDVAAVASGRRFARFTAMLREMRPRV